MAKFPRRSIAIATVALAVTAVTAAGPPAAATSSGMAGSPVVTGPIPGTAPGDRLSDRLEDTYPFFSTVDDLAGRGYVEEEFYVSGAADGWETNGDKVAEDVAYVTRMIVRRPDRAHRFNGTVLVEWQNVTAGYDLDALWNFDTVTRDGYAWVGVSAQRVGVNQLRGWSPTRYGRLDVTGGGAFLTDQLSYDIFAQAASTLTRTGRGTPLGGLRAQRLLAVGASQSAGRMTVYYDRVLPQVTPVFDGYAFIVGAAPTRVGPEPVFQVLSETDVRSPQRPADTDRFRRWEVAGGAHSGWFGYEYRIPLWERDLTVPVYNCDHPPFSRVPVHHVTAAAYRHLARWVERGTPPPTAEPLAFNPDGTKQRDELGLAVGGIRLSQVSVPTALNTGDNSGPSFCFLFGTHRPFDEATLDRLYPSRGRYVAAVAVADIRNRLAGYLLSYHALQNLHDAIESPVGR